MSVSAALSAAIDDSSDRFEIVAYGVDDLTIGFDITGSRSLGRLNELPGVATRRGKMLGEQTSWGQFGHLLGRSVSFWKGDTNRLYVQAKLAEEGELCQPSDVSAAVEELQRRMAVVGLVSYEPAWITRVDVAVDGRCRPENGKMLLDALDAVRLPNGWRNRSIGTPRSTVYFVARGSDEVKARAYCRNLKMKRGEPYGLIRLEAQERFDPKSCWLESIESPELAAEIWRSRYGDLAETVTRLEREAQVIEIAKRVSEGKLKYGQGERMSMFLALERLGLAQSYYPVSVFSARRREARRIGLSVSDTGANALEIELQELLRPYLNAVGPAACGVSPRAEEPQPRRPAPRVAPQAMDQLRLVEVEEGAAKRRRSGKRRRRRSGQGSAAMRTVEDHP
jgi:hypothetical protein